MARRPRTAEDTMKSGPQRLVALVRSSIPPVHPAGLPFIAAGLAVAGVGRKNRWLRRAGLTAAAANAGFFRHPPRTPPSRPGVVVAPADGLICLVEEVEPPAELGLPPGPRPRISIFLSLLDAHVQRIPVGGQVLAVEFRPGRFHSAELAAASEDNERNSVLIHTPDGQDVVVVQIAGLLARRIVCDLHPGDQVAIGDTYGLIRFGSRLDTYLPAGSEILVEPGQRTLAGETVLAQLP
ncbi:phosphatidylserine decarboxylase [Mycolicibacterium aichiense]|uniref:Phosphatidylserine decarboxylase proenzyme n=1 Tax=Mycolicibacterium aichiense TaxID=1799 RepID=A0AAD1MEP5_9MYCO|nr:phosphatidylserine decarboxylase [Mycolicibacterium aichiense]MCV7017411.1 phosphatidylserine decarboxylase [Mycolicibacterium aichiense]BBX10156.1 phosphatidylserine decarboxylase proenzyme [Mycolicibacterium aichiense]